MINNEFKNGDKVRLKAVWDCDIADEVFILSQWDGGKRCSHLKHSTES
jgi:hypothetical protein